MTEDEIARFILSIVGRVVFAIAIVFFGRIVAALGRRIVRRLLEQPKVAHALGPTIVRILYSLVYYVIWMLAISLALLVLGVPATFLLTATTVIIIVLALAMQQSLANFAATVIFLIFQPLKIDEDIETMGNRGTVQEIQLFNTVLLLGDKRLVTLPNSKIQENGVVNYSRMGVLRSDINMKVGYGEDLNRVKAVLTKILSAEKRALKEPPFEIAVLNLAPDGVDISARVYVKPEDDWDVRRDLRALVKTRFDAEGISFAVPQRDVRLSATSNVGRNGPTQVS